MRIYHFVICASGQNYQNYNPELQPLGQGQAIPTGSRSARPPLAAAPAPAVPPAGRCAGREAKRAPGGEGRAPAARRHARNARARGFVSGGGGARGGVTS